MEFRAEFFNILNNAGFQNPCDDGTIAGEPGVATNTLTNSREIQFGLKIHF